MPVKDENESASVFAINQLVKLRDPVLFMILGLENVPKQVKLQVIHELHERGSTDEEMFEDILANVHLEFMHGTARQLLENLRSDNKSDPALEF